MNIETREIEKHTWSKTYTRVLARYIGNNRNIDSKHDTYNNWNYSLVG